MHVFSLTRNELLPLYFEDIDAIFVVCIWLSFVQRTVSQVSHVDDPFCRGVAVSHALAHASKAARSEENYWNGPLPVILFE